MVCLAQMCAMFEEPVSLQVEKLEFMYERIEAFDRLLTEDVCT